MTENCPSLALYNSTTGAEWIKKLENITSRNLKAECPVNVRPLPRKDLSIFGIYPKNDARVLLKCNKCSKLLLPFAFVNHLQQYHTSKNQVKQNSAEKTGRSRKKRNDKFLPLFPKNSPFTCEIPLLPSLFKSVQIEVEAPTREPRDYDHIQVERKKEEVTDLMESQLRRMLATVVLDETYGSQKM